MSASPLLWAGDLEAPLAWRHGQPISRRQYLADVEALSARLPETGAMLNLSGDRYRFAVGLGAALLRGQRSLLPPNFTPDMIERLSALFPGTYVLTDHVAGSTGLHTVWHAEAHAPIPAAQAVPEVDDAAIAVQVLTSGSTGAPVPHPKAWHYLRIGVEAEAQRLAEQMGLPSFTGVTLVATVPAQHMYGFESSVLLSLLAGATIDTERPFYPADIAAALARAPRPRMLVTTPFHLKSLVESGVELPAIDLTLCATAPLSPQLAARAEAALAAPLMEIYGSTETGQVATRRTVQGAEWTTFSGVHLTGDAEAAVAQGGHVPQPTTLADVLEVLSPTSFRLLGRSNDLINIAGKRSSLGHLNYHLNGIEGVRDGAFWLPHDAPDGVVRLVAFVVAPDVSAEEIHKRVVAEMRLRVDTAFLPRRVVQVPELPRVQGTGKLPTGAFAAWAEQALAAASRR
ncbi:AMP-binding protein [Piscinibacter gummiphilus]|uniref:AMP-binding protein n=1 Tax=Piscinibacter gummiphilus TaxID=946333 RepID=A0ABZ0CVG0_9BURK|nr:AMP-binding protein [Piscinibacter gummiphilus]WOB08977.1 AMP-binding protein [Piscinibacter gummiphilus]